MQQIFIELHHISPSSTDHLIDSLYTYLKEEPFPVHLEIKDAEKDMIYLPWKKEQKIPLYIDQIIDVTSEGHYCRFVLTVSTLRVRISFGLISSLLPREQFLCCNRGVLLHMRYIVKATSNGFLMSNGDFFPTSRKKHKELLFTFEYYLAHHKKSRDF